MSSSTALFGCTDIADLTSFVDLNGDTSTPKPTQQIDPRCAKAAADRAHDARNYSNNKDEDNLPQRVYKQTYDDCLAWKQKHGG